MRRSCFSFTVLAITLAIVPAAHAVTRTWVSGIGDDAAPCSRIAPCKTFAGALVNTDAGGEISVLDPGGYGVVTITKSVTINGDGTLASILSSGLTGIIVNAGANDKVIIRNVSINGSGTGLAGIRYLAGGQLTLENVTIYGIQGPNGTGRAIDVQLSASGKLLVKDSNITNCEAGIRLNTNSGTVQANLDNVRIENTDTHAVEAVTNAVVTIKHSNLSNNFNAGVRTAAGSAVINVEDTVLAFNNAGVNAAVAGSRIRISDTTIVNNVTGITFAAGAFVESAGNNRIGGNGASTSPNATFVVE